LIAFRGGGAGRPDQLSTRIDDVAAANPPNTW
jgi:hypothetical protein